MAAKAIPVPHDTTPQYSIVVQILDAGRQYWLRDIHYKNMTVFSEQQLLEGMQIHPGEIFSREEVAKGLEAVTKLYGSQGYINFTAIPNTEFDEKDSAIALDIDVDEGEQFRMGRLEVVGSDPETTSKLVQAWEWKTGNIFSSDQIVAFIQKVWALGLDLPVSADSYRKLDERNGMVDVVLDFGKMKNCPPQDSAVNAPGSTVQDR